MRSELDPTPAPEGNATGTLEPSHPVDAVVLPRPEMPRGTAALDVVCPYLRSPDGTWRSARPQRDHRCWAQSPPAPLSTLTQSQLCLTVAHTSCDIYVAELKRRADELARDRIVPERLTGARFGALVHPVPLAIDVPGEHLLPDVPADRARLAVVALLGVLAVIVLAGGIYVLGSGPSATPPIIGLASPTVAVSITPPTPTATVAPTPRSTPRATPRPTVAPSPTPIPSATPAIARQYKVKPGDTFHSIAQRFSVTKAAILAVNDLGSPPVLTPGDKINIPVPV